MKIAIAVPPSAVPRSGNRHTAARWSRFLRSLGHRVRVLTQWDGGPDDMLLALHAYKSFPSIAKFARERPASPLVLALTGTDLYRDIREQAEAGQALRMATRLIVLQKAGLDELDSASRRKTTVVYQSSDVRSRYRPIRSCFRVAVIGHLREEKDPFRTAHALQHLDATRLEVLQIGGALDASMREEAQRWSARDSRYRWLGSVSHGTAMRWLASSHVLVVSSAMEGGANVICEAARLGVPVLASDIPGNTGMLGQNYRGYFPVFDHAALSHLIERARSDPAFYSLLRRAMVKRARLFAPAMEKSALKRAVDALPRKRVRA